MTLPAARDLSTVGIRVLTIAPGIVDTPMLATVSDEFRAGLAAGIPFPKRLRPAGRVRAARAVDHRARLPERRGHPHGRRSPHGPALAHRRLRATSAFDAPTRTNVRVAQRGARSRRRRTARHSMASEVIQSRRRWVARTSSSLYSSSRAADPCRARRRPSRPPTRYQRMEFSPPASGSRHVNPATGAMIFRPLPCAHRNCSRTIPNRSTHESDLMNSLTCAIVGMPGLPANRSADARAASGSPPARCSSRRGSSARAPWPAAGSP